MGETFNDDVKRRLRQERQVVNLLWCGHRHSAKRQSLGASGEGSLAEREAAFVSYIDTLRALSTVKATSLSKYLIIMEKYIPCVVNNIYDKIVIGPIKVLDQQGTAYDTLSKDELGFCSGTDTAESQVMIFNR